MRARHYHPALGRFLQRDPIGVWTDGGNLGNGVAFVANDPVDDPDPTGLHWEYRSARAGRGVRWVGPPPKPGPDDYGKQEVWDPFDNPPSWDTDYVIRPAPKGTPKKAATSSTTTGTYKANVKGESAGGGTTSGTIPGTGGIPASAGGIQVEPTSEMRKRKNSGVTVSGAPHNPASGDETNGPYTTSPSPSPMPTPTGPAVRPFGRAMTFGAEPESLRYTDEQSPQLAAPTRRAHRQLVVGRLDP